MKKTSDLRKWLDEEWVRIDKTKDGKHPPCGRSNADKGDYPKCVPKSKAKNMSKNEKELASDRKEKAEKNTRKNKKPHYVKTSSFDSVYKIANDFYLASVNLISEAKPKCKGTKSSPVGSPRQRAFCGRMCKHRQKNTGNEKKKNPDSCINQSLRRWKCRCP